MSISVRIAKEEDQIRLDEFLSKHYSEHITVNVGSDDNYFLIAEDVRDGQRKIVAMVGIEKNGVYGLLKSMVLEKKWWNMNTGTNFIISAIEFTKQLNVNHLYLVTKPELKSFFEVLQFTEENYEHVPNEIKSMEHYKANYQDSTVTMKNY